MNIIDRFSSILLGPVLRLSNIGVVNPGFSVLSKVSHIPANTNMFFAKVASPNLKISQKLSHNSKTIIFSANIEWSLLYFVLQKTLFSVTNFSVIIIWKTAENVCRKSCKCHFENFSKIGPEPYGNQTSSNYRIRFTLFSAAKVQLWKFLKNPPKPLRQPNFDWIKKQWTLLCLVLQQTLFRHSNFYRYNYLKNADIHLSPMLQVPL